MAPRDTAERHRQQVQATAQTVSAELTGLWAGVDRDNIPDSWMDRVPAAVATIGAAQQRAAQDSESYVRNVLDEQGVDPDGRRIDPSGFAGMTYPLGGAAAVPLEVAVASPAFATLSYIGSGRDVERSMTAGLMSLITKAQTAVADASRQAVGVTSATTQAPVRQVRVIQPGACARCVILAGRIYRDASFLRHPGCNCTAMPTSPEQAGALATDPYAHFEGLTPEEQERKFGKANAQAIRDGGDIFQIVNAQKDVYDARGATYYGTTRRANWGRQQSDIRADRSLRQTNRRRLTPEAIYQQPGGRERHTQLLEEYGYILPQGQNPGGVIAFGSNATASINR